MEEDIDIEEHDVLEHPRIRNIFGADLTQIKSEIPDEDYFDEPMEYENSLEERHSLQIEENVAEYARCGNKIILGSRPASTSSLQIREDIQNGEPVLIFGRKAVEIKKEIDEYGQVDELHPQHIDEDYELNLSKETHEDFNEHNIDKTSNIIIIGSRPSTSGLIEPLRANRVSISKDVTPKNSSLGNEVNKNAKRVENTHRDPADAFVLLENWGPRLENSSCYCRECHILFATRNTLAAHNMTDHSFLVAVNKNKAVKSTAKPNVGGKKSGTGKFCNHCNKMFPDSDSLINHLYEKLTFDKNKPTKSTFQYQPKKVIAAPYEGQTKIILGKTQNVGSSSKIILGKNQHFTERTEENDNPQEDYFRCEVCSCYFHLYKNFHKHMHESHKRSNFNKVKVFFDGSCLYCNNEYTKKAIYNHHVRMKHPTLYFLKEDKLPIVLKIPKTLAATKGQVSIKPESVAKPKTFPPEEERERKIGHYECRVCGKIFPNHPVAKYHRRRHHPEEKGRVILTKISADQPALQYIYQCMECDEVLSVYSEARRHRMLRHPELKTQALFKKVMGKAESIKTVPQNTNSPGSSPTKTPNKANCTTTKVSPVKKIVVPKAILFKCNKCDIHFTSCMSVVLHSKSCTKQTGDWECKICYRHFQTSDQFVHRMQHNVTEEFRVITCHENIYGRVLNQCPNCKLYFHEKYFYLHVQKSPCNRASIKCGQCTLSIHASSAEEHIKWHRRIKTTKSNAILVEFATSVANKPSEGVKRNILSDDPEIPTKKAKVESYQIKSKMIVRYCQLCCCYTFGNAFLRRHKNGECQTEAHTAKKQFCKFCGLSYVSQSHIHFHKTNPDVTLLDMSFSTVQTKQVIAPPIPDFPKCTKCKVHFCKISTIDAHNCKDSYKTCRHCQKRFSDLALKLHTRFHDYHNLFRKPQQANLHGTPLTTNQPRKPQTTNTPGKPQTKNPPLRDPLSAPTLSELIKKYEKLPDTWNILFLCQTCDIVCDSYDQTIEHCQKHFNNMQSYDMVVEHCKTCNMQFDSTCFERHEELHTQNQSLTKDSFRILPYEYTNLFKSEWMDQFKSLPETQMEQIVARSIYKHGYSVKLRVVQEGPPETTVYICGQCDLGIHPRTLTYHRLTNSCGNVSMKFNCHHCNISFCSFQARAQHEIIHKTNNVFKIVYVNEDGDEQFNKTLNENELNQKSDTINLKNTKFNFYKCETCQRCMIYNTKNVSRHRCPRKNNTKAYCEICKLYFAKIGMNRHREFHKRNPNLNRKNIRLIPINRGAGEGIAVAPKTEREDKNPIILFKCKCGLHFNSRKAIIKHFTICGTVIIAKEKCSKCQRLFDTTQLVTHLCNHHSKNNTHNEFKVIRVSKIKTETQDETETTKNLDESRTLYVCRKCDVHYLCYNSLNYHCRNNHQCSKIIRCQHCKLRFMPKTLMKHIVLHHQKTKTNASDFCIRSWPENQTSKPKIVVSGVRINNKVVRYSPQARGQLVEYTRKLYQCNVCNTVFLTSRSLLSHGRRAVDKTVDPHNILSVRKCDQCEYIFSAGSMRTHRLVHHVKMKLKREDFLISRTIENKRTYYKKTNKDSDLDLTLDDEDNESVNNEQDSHETINTDDDSTRLDKTEEPIDDEKLSNKKDPTDDEKLCNKKDKDTYKYCNIIFKCGVCDVLSLKGREQHVILHASEQKNPFTDSREPQTCYCGLRFSAHSIVNHQIFHHEKQNLSKDDLYIIEMNLYNGDTVASNHVYRCSVCEINYFKLENLKQHSSGVEHNVFKKKCEKCGLIFSSSGIFRHMTVHHDIMKLNRPEDYIVLLSEGDKVKVLRGLDEAVPTAKEEKITRPGDTESSEKINERNTRYNDNSNETGVDGEAETEEEISAGQIKLKQEKHILYRCTQCQCCFFSLQTLKSHKYLCETAPTRSKCEKCSLLFFKPSLKRHEKLHKTCKDLKIDDFIIEEPFSYEYFTKVYKKSKEPTEMSEELSKEPTEVSEELSTLNTDLYNKNLFKCSTCSIHFMLEDSLNVHVNDPKTVTKSTCTFCALTFLVTTLPTHVYIHHEKMNLTADEFKITSKEEIMDQEFEDETESQIESGNDPTVAVGQVESSPNNDELLPKNSPKVESIVAPADSVVLDEEPNSIDKNPELSTTLPTHVYIHHEKMNLTADEFKITSKEEIMDQEFEDETESQIESVEDDVIICSEGNDPTVAVGQVESSPNNDELLPKNSPNVESIVAPADSVVLDEEPNSIDKNPEQSKSFESEEGTQSSSNVDSGSLIKLYKCADCHVCFLSQTSCYKHVTKHTPIQAKDYIACKLCGYQFMVLNNSLHKHITKHHNKNFKSEDVLIEEYHPNILCHGSPKIDIYYGSDKVQSKLISTTSEGNVSSELSKENGNVKMSDNGVIDLDSSDTSAIDSSDNKDVILIEEN